MMRWNFLLGLPDDAPQSMVIARAILNIVSLILVAFFWVFVLSGHATFPNRWSMIFGSPVAGCAQYHAMLSFMAVAIILWLLAFGALMCVQYIYKESYKQDLRKIVKNPTLLLYILFPSAIGTAVMMLYGIYSGLADIMQQYCSWGDTGLLIKLFFMQFLAGGGVYLLLDHSALFLSLVKRRR